MKSFFAFCIAIFFALSSQAQSDSTMLKLKQLNLTTEQKLRLKMLMLDQRKEQLQLKEKYFQLLQQILTKEQLDQVQRWRESKRIITPKNTH